MKSQFNFLVRFLILISFLSPLSQAKELNGFDLDALEKILGGDGLPCLVHGIVKERSQYVIGYRDPKDPMHAIQFPVIGTTAELREELKKLKRNDKVRLFGKFKAIDTPQPHIEVTKMEGISKWDWEKLPQAEIKTSSIKEIKDAKSLVGKVHGVVGEGKILLLDYKDQIFPISVENTEVSKTLWVNDKVRVKHLVQESPGRPIHLLVDEKQKKSIEVLQYMSELKGQATVLKGTLAKYPKSALAREAYAIEVTDEDGVRQFYFVLGGDDNVAKSLQAKFAEVWKQAEGSVLSYRSRQINSKIHLEVTGKASNPQGAGNPQIFIESMENIKVTVDTKK